MTSRDFCYWLQGFFELTNFGNPATITEQQLIQIKNHLNLVFKHEIDPSFGEEQEELNKIHNQHLWNQPNPGDTLVRC